MKVKQFALNCLKSTGKARRVDKASVASSSFKSISKILKDCLFASLAEVLYNSSLVFFFKLAYTLF